MVNHISQLKEARKLFLDLLGDHIINDDLVEDISQLKITFKTGQIVYIRYNEFNEYGYQILFSTKKNDSARFDNFDDKWEVSTRPHHFHERGSDNVVKSSMNGDPTFDIPLLVEYLKEEIKFP
ncbi:MAG: hypothetical protein EU548_04465 [Promethearchaeota archaeon]|nr:MAG: hypothetical protein EU548_04465 [Candidatus Lokiarchaeota archaeon]